MSSEEEKKEEDWEKIRDARKPTKFGDGHSDNLEPLQSLDLSKVKSVNDLVTGMKHTAFAGRNVGEAADVLEEMVKDKSCYKVLTLSGAMTIAKMGLVICDMIDHGLVDCIISTGALMAHGFIESAGMTHFKYRPDMDDEELYAKGYDRVYDTLELEKNLDDAEVIIDKILSDWDEKKELCSYTLNLKLGEYLHKNTKGKGVLKSAYEKNVPIYIPAFTDSEFGLDFALHLKKREIEKKPLIKFDPFLDLEHYTNKILEAKTTGIFTIGGGVPRNWAQQVGPYLDIINLRLVYGGNYEKYLEVPDEKDKYCKRFKYAVRICPEPVHFGGLSGCTYEEGVSWGKFIPKSQGGKQVEVLTDATVAWPMVVKAVLERLGKT